jgi:C4-dicarboxylate-binding protein DctP
MKLLKTTAILAALTLGTAVQAQVQIVMSNDNNEKGLKGQTFEVLVDELENRLGDQVAVEIHHSGTLFDQHSQIQGLQLGGAHIISPTAGIYSSVAPKVAALQLPFLLNTPEKIQAAMADPIVREAILPGLQAQNIEIVAVWMNGPRDLGYNGAKPILRPEDATGLKVRVQSAPIFVETWEAAGANPVGINWSESPTALQQGVIDAAEVTPNSWRGSSTYQFIDHISKTEHQYSFYLVGANKAWWDGLSAEVREEVQAALEAATEWNMGENERINGADLDYMAEQGVQIHDLSDEDRSAWIEAMQPVWQHLGTDLVGEDVMSRLKAIGSGNDS